MAKLIQIKAVNYHDLPESDFLNELINAEQKLNSDSLVRYHIYADPWVKVAEDKPKEGEVVLCHCPDWIREDNPKGLRTCHYYAGRWYRDKSRNIIISPSPTHYYNLICPPDNTDCLC